MRVLLVKDNHLLKAATEDDLSLLDSLIEGRTYRADIKSARNVRFHCKYMKLMRTAWEYLRENQQEFFRNNLDNFRKTIEVAAGCSERVYSLSRREWLEVPRSIAFDKMEEAEFRTLYERVKDVLFNTALKGINEQEFMNTLIDF